MSLKKYTVNREAKPTNKQELIDGISQFWLAID